MSRLRASRVTCQTTGPGGRLRRPRDNHVSQLEGDLLPHLRQDVYSWPCQGLGSSGSVHEFPGLGVRLELSEASLSSSF